MEEIQNRIQTFQDKKRQKIQFMKECLDQRELEECNFAPTLSAKKKKGNEDPRNLDRFLEDQSKYDELKKQKAQERMMETEKVMISQMVKPSYVN